MTTAAQPLIPIEVWEPEQPGVARYTEKYYVGEYLHCAPSWCWSVPALATFKLRGDHPLIPMLSNCRRRVVNTRMVYNGKEYTGRVHDAECEWDGQGEEIWTFYCMSNLFWILTTLAWVNPQFPAEVQVGLTGKQDIMFGPLDWVFKWFAARNWIRQDVPVYVGLPVRANNPGLPTLGQLFDLDELLEYVNGFDIVALSARFPYLDELYKQTVESTEIGMTMDLVIPSEYIAAGQPMPMIFNTSGLAQLQSIIDYTSDNFLNITKLATIPQQWNSVPSEPCYVFNTREKRDRKHMVWQLRGGQIRRFKRKVTHAKMSHVIVGGRAPDAMNMLVEFAANLIIQAIAGAITAAFGLPGVGAVAVGGVFDNIFFAFQHFWDAELEADLGRDGFKEGFGDNTSAWSLDTFAVGLAKLREGAGDDTLTFEVVSGEIEDGYEFGADFEIIDGEVVDLSDRRFQEGDEMTFYHQGTFVTSWVSTVEVEDARDGRRIERVSFGNQKQLDVIGQIFERLGGLFSVSRAFAVT